MAREPRAERPEMSNSRTVAVLLGAALLIGALFAPWYAVELGPAAREALSSQANQLPAAFADFAKQLVTMLPERIEATAWMAFERTDVVLLGTAIAAAFAALLQRLEIAAVAGAIGAGNIVWVMFQRPGPSELISLQWGAWLALGGALLIVGASIFRVKMTSAPYVPPIDYSLSITPMSPVPLLADTSGSVAPPPPG
jgi:hypothetical protein